MSTTNANTAALWKDNKELPPDFKVICEASQDPGNLRRGKKGVSIVKFGVLSKFAADVCSNMLKAYPKHDGLDKNISRGKEDLLRMMIVERKQHDVSVTAVEFHEHASEGKVFAMVPSDVLTAGVDKAFN